MLTKDQKYPSVQKEYSRVDFETDSPALAEKAQKTAKLSYLYMLQLLLGWKGEISTDNLRVSVEPLLASRVG